MSGVPLSFCTLCCSCVVGKVVLVVVKGVVSRVGCLGLLLKTSLSMDTHFEPSCGKVVSFVRSLWSLRPEPFLLG